MLKTKAPQHLKSPSVGRAENAVQAHGPSSSDQVVSAIRRGIREGRYVYGQRLIEADLTRILQVSRGPIREALKRLAAEGIVVLNPHRGAYIQALQRSEALDLLAVLEVVIGLAARLAATRIGEGASSQPLTSAYERLKNKEADGGYVERADFYDSIFEIAGNHELTRINPVIQAHLLRTQVNNYLSEQERLKQFGDYCPLTEALLAGNAMHSERIVRRHIRRSRQQVEQLDEGAFSSSP